MMQSGKDRHIVEKRGANSRNGGKGSPCCFMQGPVLACSRGIIAAVPKFIKSTFLDKHSKRWGWFIINNSLGLVVRVG